MALRTKFIWIAATLAIACAIFFVGRVTAPVSVRTVSIEASRAATATTAETAKSVTVVTREVTRWRDRVVTKPDGTRIETHEAMKGDEKRDERREATRKVDVKVEERLVYRESRPVLPTWSLEVAAGTGLDLKPRYQAGVARRLVGGLWLTLTADVTGRAALAGLRFDF